MKINPVYFLGIDPGQKGGSVLLNESAEIISSLSFIQYKDEWPEAFASFLVKVPKSSAIYLERVHSMPQQGVSSVFTFGKNFGLVQGILVASGFSYQLVLPKAWQKTVWMTREDDPKDNSVFAAVEIWGPEPFIRSKRCTVPDSGLVDAALIAEYGRRLEIASRHRGLVAS